MTTDVALVTGAARRIGRAIALRLARENFAVAIHCNRSRDEAESLRREIEASGGRAIVLVAELGESTQCAVLMRDAARALGPVTLLVNNASIFESDDATTLSDASFARHIDVNLRAPLVLAREMAAALPADRDGAIVNILDQRVFKPTPHFLSYALSKEGLRAATEILAQSFAPRIRVNAVAPGPTAANIRQAPEDFAKQAAATPLAKPVAPDDVADAVVYLTRAKSVTGVTLAVDGGQRLAWETPDVKGIRE